MICIHFTRAHIYHRRHGTSIVSLDSTLPPPTPLEKNLSLQFRVLRDEALQFVRQNFPGVPIEEVSDDTIPAVPFRRPAEEPPAGKG